MTHRRTLPLKTFLYGAAYYPEHWDAATREEDPARMRAAGFNLVRMGEFAWHLFEPVEGRFRFGWLDTEIARLADAGIHTMLCTPTAAPPAWLTHADPSVLRIDADGRTMCHGSRQHASHFSPRFRARSRAITQAMAEHYRTNPHVIGWQTDNEFHCHFAEDHGDAAQAAFRDFLRERYQGDITALNRAWGTAFWAAAYADFPEIETPRRNRPTHLNPSQVLDYQRFLSWGVTRFQREQVEILRAANPAWWVTHNGCFASIDYRGDFTRDLDFLAYDSYPFFDNDPRRRAASHAANLDHARAFSGNFMVPEQQAGPGGQTEYLHDTPEPGEMRRMALASIAHGADSLLFFRWRSCRFGAEEYWCGLIDHDNQSRRRYGEAARLGAELQRLGPALLGSSVRMDVAIAGADFDNLHAHAALHHGLPGPRQAGEAAHGFFFRRQHAVGIVHPSDDLRGIQLYLAPHLPLWKAEWIDNLRAWVEEGGVLVIGPRAGCKLENNQVTPEPLPGLVRVLTGSRVEEYGRQNRPDLRPLALRLGDTDVATSLWYEVLEPDPGTEVVATWTTRHLAGKAAMTRRKLGKGEVIHVGAWLDEPLLAALADWLDANMRLPPGFGMPEGLEVVEREFPDGRVLGFLINHNDRPVRFELAESAVDLLGGLVHKGSVELPAQDVLVLDHATWGKQA